MSRIVEYQFNNQKWDIKERFANIRVTSKYSSYCYGEDKDDKVLIRKITVGKNVEDIKKNYKEIVLLKNINHENVVKLIDLYTRAITDTSLEEFYLVTTYMGSTLKDVMKTQKLEIDHIKFFTYQILRGLKYLHSMKIAHTDLKPSSIGINENLELRIQDLYSYKNEDESNGYITSKYYRAPELILQCNYEKYLQKSDMWSVGCILAEMLLQVPLFLAKEVQQLKLIFKFVEFPDCYYSRLEETARKIVDKIKEELDSEKEKSNEEKENLDSHLNNIDSEAKQLIKSLLLINPESRKTAVEALNDVFVKDFHDESDEPNGTEIKELKKINEIDLTQFKRILFEEIRKK